MSNTIYDADIVKVLPQALSEDTKMIALATALASELKTVTNAIDNATIYARIDDIPEALLDVLAYDFHCDWYDIKYPIEVKRNILKSNVKMHKRLGTKYAVERALKDIYETASVEEWFDYDGRPYTFRINITIGEWGISEDAAVQIIKKMWYYKNLRSHCDCIFYTLNAPKATIRAAPHLAFGELLKIKARPETEIQSTGIETATAGMRTAETVKVKAIPEAEILTAGRKTTTAYISEAETMKVKAVPETELQSTGKKYAAASMSTLGELKIKASQEKVICSTAKKTTTAYIKEIENIKVKATQEEKISTTSKTATSASATVAETLVVKAEHEKR